MATTAKLEFGVCVGTALLVARKMAASIFVGGLSQQSILSGIGAG